MSNINKFVELFLGAFDGQQLVKLSLSGSKSELKNIYAKRIQLRDGAAVSFTLRYATRDETKNMQRDEAAAWLVMRLNEEFGIANLLTTVADWTWERRGDKLRQRKPSQQQAPSQAHNQAKQYLVAENADFLRELGISSPNGRVHAQAQDKFRQINKYVEVMNGYLGQISVDKPINVVDMGCGKGYLTFALYAEWRGRLAAGLRVVGLELRPALCEQSNEIAAKLGYGSGLSFRALDIMDYPAGEIDVLVALHACDTATDIAIAKGIQSGARLIVVAPCCHRQVRRQMQAGSLFQPILRHGILEERQAELLTDGIRALLLEAEGYRTQVFEFVSPEHTAKNLMISAVYTGQKNKEAKQQIARLKAEFGISEHALEALLGFPMDKM